MLRNSPIIRISLGLVLVTVSVLFSGDLLFRLGGGEEAAALESRKRLCETLAIQLSTLMESDDVVGVEKTLEYLVRRTPDMLSAGLRHHEGELLVEAGVHARYWKGIPFDKSTPTHAQVPIYKGDERFATVEVRFKPLPSTAFSDLWTSPFFRFVLFVAVVGFFGYVIFMKRTLKHLDPAAVIPGRVKTALDVLAEGVVLLDEKFEIVPANTAFAKELDQPANDLLGLNLSMMDWETPDGAKLVVDSPWERATRLGESQVGVPLRLATANDGLRTFVVNASPILDEGNEARGTMVTFDDVTALEQANGELKRSVEELRASRNEIRRQNEALSVLAMQDPLTSCLNRRSFFEKGDTEIADAGRDDQPVSCIMLDIDHFKSINDTYGHGIGDQVIQKLADTLRIGLRSVDMVGRYGGEEFCVLLPGLEIDKAGEIAERLRQRIEAELKSALGPGAERNVTSSFGVVSSRSGATDVHELVDHADQALYASKNNGRNRVTRWDELDHQQVA